MHRQQYQSASQSRTRFPIGSRTLASQQSLHSSSSTVKPITAAWSAALLSVIPTSGQTAASSSAAPIDASTAATTAAATANEAANTNNALAAAVAYHRQQANGGIVDSSSTAAVELSLPPIDSHFDSRSSATVAAADSSQDITPLMSASDSLAPATPILSGSGAELPTADSGLAYSIIDWFSTWWPGTELAVKLFSSVHHLTDTPWYISIPITTVLIRLAFFPLTIRQHRKGALLRLAQPEQQQLLDAFKAKQQSESGISMADNTEFTTKRSALMKRYNVRMMDMLLMPALMMPTFLSVLSALQHHMPQRVSDWSTGGFEPLINLSTTGAACYCVMPLVNASLQALCVAVGADTGASGGQQTPMQIVIQRVMIGFMFASIYFTRQFPISVLMYWIANSCTSLVQVLLFKNQRVRTLFSIPYVPSGVLTPADCQLALERYKAGNFAPFDKAPSPHDLVLANARSTANLTPQAAAQEASRLKAEAAPGVFKSWVQEIKENAAKQQAQAEAKKRKQFEQGQSGAAEAAAHSPMRLKPDAAGTIEQIRARGEIPTIYNTPMASSRSKKQRQHNKQ